MHCANLLIIIHSRVLQSSSIYIYVAAVYVPDSWSTQESFSMTEREFSRDLRTFMCIICFAHYHRVYVLFESSSSRSDQSRRERKKLITMRTRSYIDSSTSTTTHLISLAGKLFNSQYCTSMHYCIFVTISMFPYPMEKLIGFNSDSSSFSA